MGVYSSFVAGKQTNRETGSNRLSAEGSAFALTPDFFRPCMSGVRLGGICKYVIPQTAPNRSSSPSVSSRPVASASASSHRALLHLCTLRVSRVDCLVVSTRLALPACLPARLPAYESSERVSDWPCDPCLPPDSLESLDSHTPRPCVAARPNTSN